MLWLAGHRGEVKGLLTFKDGVVQFKEREVARWDNCNDCNGNFTQHCY